MKRFILLGAMPLLMAGCVPLIPLPISLVSSGLSGISLLATGKSTTDHVISAANKQDCAMHRVAFGEEICRNYDAGEYRPDTRYTSQFPGDHDQGPQVAETPNFWDDDLDTNTAELPEQPKQKQKIDPLLISSLTTPTRLTAVAPADLGGFQPAPLEEARDIRAGNWGRPEAPMVVESVALPPLPRNRPSTASLIDKGADLRFLSLGSFRSPDRAKALVKRFASLSPTVMTVEVAGKSWRRVAVGPMTKTAVERLRLSHARIDGRDTWTFIK
jgi:hypothetical protein